jgi:hypothetical protein
MTEHTTRDGRRDDEHRRGRHRPTLGDLTHTNPQTGESFGDAMVYHRGPTVAADGGTERPDERQDPESADGETLGDLDHTPPRDADDANTVHERGGEHPEEDEESV